MKKRDMQKINAKTFKFIEQFEHQTFMKHFPNSNKVLVCYMCLVYGLQSVLLHHFLRGLLTSLGAIKKLHLNKQADYVNSARKDKHKT